MEKLVKDSYGDGLLVQVHHDDDAVYVHPKPRDPNNPTVGMAYPPKEARKLARALLKAADRADRAEVGVR